MPLASRTLFRLSAPVTVAALVASGCASLGAGITSPGASSHVDLDSPALRSFAVANMTEMERDVRLDTGDREHKPVTPPLFWTGIALGTVGAVGGIAFGVAGFASKNELNNAHNAGGGLTVAEHDRLVRNGDRYNTLAISFTAAAIVGYALALVSYGVDWNRCGPLAEKKRRCKDNRLGRYAAD
jgi:hypothetical protein